MDLLPAVPLHYRAGDTVLRDASLGKTVGVSTRMTVARRYALIAENQAILGETVVNPSRRRPEDTMRERRTNGRTGAAIHAMKTGSE